MRDPERIERILRQVYLIWRRNPDLRLLQLLINAGMKEGGLRQGGLLPPTFQLINFEDDELEQVLQRIVDQKISAVDQLGALEPFRDAIIRHDC